MNLLQSHFEQISLSSTAIAELPFSFPRPFTNALLRTTDITTLIRDTGAHERALFTLATQDTTNPNTSASASGHRGTSSSSRQQARKSIYDVAGLNDSTEKGYGSSTIRMRHGGVRANSTVGRILGGDLLARIQRARRADGSTATSTATTSRGGKGELDVGALLDGAERLCEVYPIAGARSRITHLRQQHEALAASIERYEHIVEGQARELEKVNQGRDAGAADVAGVDEVDVGEAEFTRDDLRREEREIKELEERRKLLEQRVHGMERDLGGLMK